MKAPPTPAIPDGGRRASPAPPSAPQPPPVLKAARNLGWLLADRASRVGINLALNIAIARSLGPHDFGALAYALSLLAIFQVVAGCGLEDVLARDLVTAGAPRARLLAALKIKAAAVLLTFVAGAGFLAVWRHPDPATSTLALVVLIALFFSPLDLVDLWFQSRERVALPVLTRQLAFLLSAGLRVGLLLTHARLVAFGAAVVVESALTAIGLFIVLRQDLRASPRPEPPTRIEPLRLLREGAPLMLSGLLVVLAMQADRLLLVNLSGESSAGVYAAAARITEALYALPLAASVVAMPRLATLGLGNRSAYWHLARRITLGLGLLVVAIATLLGLAATTILPTLFGPRFQDAGPVLAVHVWSLVFVSLVSLRSRLLVIDRAGHWTLIFSAVTATLAIVGNLILIPRFGAMGAAWTTVGAWGISALLLPWLPRTTRRQMRAWCGWGEAETVAP